MLLRGRRSSSVSRRARSRPRWAAPWPRCGVTPCTASPISMTRPSRRGAGETSAFSARSASCPGVDFRNRPVSQPKGWRCRCSEDGSSSAGGAPPFRQAIRSASTVWGRRRGPRSTPPAAPAWSPAADSRRTGRTGTVTTPAPRRTPSPSRPRRPPRPSRWPAHPRATRSPADDHSRGPARGATTASPSRPDAGSCGPTRHSRPPAPPAAASSR